MSLLTDGIIEELRELVSHSEYHDWTELELQRHADTIKGMTLKAVAEWLGEYCGYHLNLKGRPVDSPPKRRRMCGFCRENLLEALREGKMPGEEA